MWLGAYAGLCADLVWARRSATLRAVPDVARFAGEVALIGEHGLVAGRSSTLGIRPPLPCSWVTVATSCQEAVNASCVGAALREIPNTCLCRLYFVGFTFSPLERM